MAEATDQAPQYQDNPNDEPQAHPERVGTSFPGATTPAYEGYQPQPLDKRPGSGKRLLGYIATGVSLTAITAGIVHAVDSGVNVGRDLINSDKSNSAAPSPGMDIDRNPGLIETRQDVTLDNASIDQFYSDEYFTDEERVNWAWDKLQQPSTDPRYEGMSILRAKFAELQEKYNEPNYKYIQDYVEPSEGMAGDEILSLQTIIHTIAAESDLSDTERAKILAAALDNSDPLRTAAVGNALTRDVVHLNGIYRVNQSPDGTKWESPVFRDATLSNGYNAKGIPSKIISSMNVMGNSNSEAGNDFQEIYRFINNVPVRVDFYSAKDTTKWVSKVYQIPTGS